MRVKRERIAGALWAASVDLLLVVKVRLWGVRIISDCHTPVHRRQRQREFEFGQLENGIGRRESIAGPAFVCAVIDGHLASILRDEYIGVERRNALVDEPFFAAIERLRLRRQHLEDYRRRSARVGALSGRIAVHHYVRVVNPFIILLDMRLHVVYERFALPLAKVVAERVEDVASNAVVRDARSGHRKQFPREVFVADFAVALPFEVLLRTDPGVAMDKAHG